MYSPLLHAHSGLRWLVLVALIVAIVVAFKHYNKEQFSKSHKTTYLVALILTHLQLVIGFVLYFISPRVVFNSETMKDSVLRFLAVEHLALMLFAIIMITMGYSRSKRAKTLQGKHSAIAVFYTVGLIAILLGIPWPFRGLGGHWF